MSFTRVQTTFREGVKLPIPTEETDDIPGVVTNESYKIQITSPSQKSTAHSRMLSSIEEENFSKDTTLLYNLVKHAIETLEVYIGYTLNSVFMTTIEFYSMIPANDKLCCWIQTAIAEKEKIERRSSKTCCFFSTYKMKPRDKEAYKLFSLIGELDNRTSNEDAIVSLKESLNKLGEFYIPNEHRLSPTLPPESDQIKDKVLAKQR